MKKINMKYISPKIVSTALALTLITTSLAGCTKDFQYKIENISGKDVVIVSGTMDRDIAEDLKIIELKVFDENYLFLTRRSDIGKTVNGRWAYTYEYWDVFENYKIISLTGEKGVNPIDINSNEEGIELVKEESLNNYLLYYGYKNKEYDIETLKEIFYKIQYNYEFESDKQLVKE